MIRALPAVASLALVSILAAGCSDGDPDTDAGETDSDAPVVALTADQIAEAVLQEENMGEGWTSAPSDEDEGGAPGCIGEVGILTDGLKKKARGGTEFNHGDALRVESSVSVYGDETALAAVFDQVQTVLTACTAVSGADPDGNDWDLTLATTDEVTFDGVDDQYSVSGSGTITTPTGTEIGVHLETTAVRVGPNIGSISTFDTASRTTEHAVWAEIAVERLVDVAEGEEPEPTTAPAPEGAPA